MLPHSLRSSSPLLIAALFLYGFCPDLTPPPPPTAGSVEFHIVTTGADVDPDGFLISIDGKPPIPVSANGPMSWTGSLGEHIYEISGLAFNCDLTTPASALFTLGALVKVPVQVTCTPYLQNAIVYTSEEFGYGEVMAMRPDGSRRVRLTTDQQVYGTPVVSPDGQSIAVSVGNWTGGTWNGTDGIYVLDRFGKTKTKVVGRSRSDASVAWSPDGTKLAFRSMSPGKNGDYGRIWIVNRDGTGLRQLTPETDEYTFDDSPAWSRDGTQVLYSHFGDLWLINADGTSPHSIGVGGMYPSWSPDGSKIAFSAWTNQKEAIFVADRDGANVHQVTTPTQQDDWPRWSVDGKQIVFERVENDVFQLWRMDADGANLAKLSVQPKSEGSPSWNPGT